MVGITRSKVIFSGFESDIYIYIDAITVNKYKQLQVVYNDPAVFHNLDFFGGCKSDMADELT